MPLPRSPNRRAAIRTLAAIPFIAAARGTIRPHTTHHPAHHVPGGFRNTAPDFSEARGWPFTLWIMKRLLRTLVPARETVNIPHMPPGYSHQFESDRDAVTWIGHTTVLVQMEGKRILTDPVWSRRAGPAPMLGAQRITAPGLSIGDLPALDIILISHNHYDHLDADAVHYIAEHHPRAVFFVPLGLGEWVKARGASLVQELDWWESRSASGLTVTCAPAQHFSGRGLGDHNRTLWATWSVEGATKKLFFGGDSGYEAPLFKEIGKRLGPFDLALMPIGAYEPRTFMRPVHMDPAEAVQASLDIGARSMLGTHWGTFLLTDERADDPPKKMEEAVRSRGLPHEHYWTFMLGETRAW